MGRRRARSVATALLLCLAAPSCMFLVDDELGSIGCMDEGAYGPPACPTGHACVEGLCAPQAAPAPALGTSCSSNADCNEGDFCFDPTGVGEPAQPVCSRACCSSIDCDEMAADGEVRTRAVCWVPALGGGSFCRDGHVLEREQIGAQKAGDKCIVDADCRSGVCRSDHCADACCSDTNCELTGSRCLVTDGLASEGSAWACAPTPMTTKGYLEPCLSDAECDTGLCIKMADELRCSRPCCDSASCGPIASGSVTGQLACVHLPHHGSFIAACARVLPTTAELPVGAPCSGDLECRSGVCSGTEASPMDRYCSDLCCVDADCGDPTLACRPRLFGATDALHCLLR